MSSSQAMVALENIRSLANKGALSKILRSIPVAKLAKLVICFLFLLNIQAWPFAWHIRVFRLAIVRRLQHRVIRIRMLFTSRKAGLELEDRWLESIAPVGAHPFKRVVPFTTWASIDESDYNGHLSNSSYAKILDNARLKAAIELFPLFFPAGGWIGLAASHYHFIREIPMLSTYEIRLSIASWDHKWMYILAKFVRKSDGKQKKKSTITKPTLTTPEISAETMIIRTAGSELESTTGTPFTSDTPIIKNIGASTNTEENLKAVAAGLAGEEPDGAVLHTLVMTQLCYKIGRITIPPALVLAVNGFTGAEGHSMASPHPQWLEAKKVMSKPIGGSTRKLRNLLVGGWRDVPESERWWDQALGPEVETRRVKNLALIEGLKKGLENARTL